MAKKKKNKPIKKIKETDIVFDYKDYIEKTFTSPKAFLYYVLVNDLKLTSKEEVDKAYKTFNGV